MNKVTECLAYRYRQPKKIIIVTGNYRHGENFSNGCRYIPARKTIVGYRYIYKPPNAYGWVKVTRAFFNISRLNKSRQYFKMVDEKNNVTFHVSEQFKSFQSLQEKISSYETENFVKLWIRDSRSISAAQGRVKRKLSDEIRYYELMYAGIHGGKKFKPRG